jgi:hypothetical protein
MFKRLGPFSGAIMGTSLERQDVENERAATERVLLSSAGRAAKPYPHSRTFLNCNLVTFDQSSSPKKVILMMVGCCPRRECPVKSMACKASEMKGHCPFLIQR